MAENISDKLKAVLGDRYEDYANSSRANALESKRRLTDEEIGRIKEAVKVMSVNEKRFAFDSYDVLFTETRNVKITPYNTGSVSIPVLWNGIYVTAFFDKMEEAQALAPYSVYLLVGNLKEREINNVKRYHINVLKSIQLA